MWLNKIIRDKKQSISVLVHAMKLYGGIRRTAPLNLNSALDNGEWLTSRPSRWDQYRCFWGEKNFLVLPQFEPRTFHHVASPYTTLSRPSSKGSK
jgi:hypothetical protein